MDRLRARARAAACAAALVAWVPAASTGLIAAPSHAGTAGETRLIHIPAGSYRPLYKAPEPAASRPRTAPRATTIRVPAFEMDAYPVTNAQFLAFVQTHPQWRRSRASRLFVEATYLRHWASDLELGPGAPPDSPVVSVSWFAARAYLQAHGRQLPTVDQWEYVAAADETRRDASRTRAFLDRLRIWYGRPTPAVLPPVTAGLRNVYGVAGLHGLVWEWTLDFNSALVTGESRADVSLDRDRYCGSGAAGASDFEDYAAFMRYAFRSSLDARYTVANLGFRGVRTTRTTERRR